MVLRLGTNSSEGKQKLTDIRRLLKLQLGILNLGERGVGRRLDGSNSNWVKGREEVDSETGHEGWGIMMEIL